MPSALSRSCLERCSVERMYLTTVEQQTLQLWSLSPCNLGKNYLADPRGARVCLTCRITDRARITHGWGSALRNAGLLLLSSPVVRNSLLLDGPATNCCSVCSRRSIPRGRCQTSLFAAWGSAIPVRWSFLAGCAPQGPRHTQLWNQSALGCTVGRSSPWLSPAILMLVANPVLLRHMLQHTTRA